MRMYECTRGMYISIYLYRIWFSNASEARRSSIAIYTTTTISSQVLFLPTITAACAKRRKQQQQRNTNSSYRLSKYMNEFFRFIITLFASGWMVQTHTRCRIVCTIHIQNGARNTRLNCVKSENEWHRIHHYTRIPAYHARYIVCKHIVGVLLRARLCIGMFVGSFFSCFYSFLFIPIALHVCARLYCIVLCSIGGTYFALRPVFMNEMFMICFRDVHAVVLLFTLLMYAHSVVATSSFFSTLFVVCFSLDFIDRVRPTLARPCRCVNEDDFEENKTTNAKRQTHKKNCL